MQLIGVNRSPYTRRVAITLEHYGMPYEQRDLNGFAHWDEIKISNPLGRIPALVLDDGEALLDSEAIVDHLDELYGPERALTPPRGADRRAVLRVSALMMGACDKGLHAAYERNHHPPEKVHLPWIEDCTKRMKSALKAIDAMAEPGQYLLLGRLTQPTSPLSSPSGWRAGSASTPNARCRACARSPSACSSSRRSRRPSPRLGARDSSRAFLLLWTASVSLAHERERMIDLRSIIRRRLAVRKT